MVLHNFLFLTYIMLKWFLRTSLTPASKNVVYGEKKSNPKVHEIKPELFLSSSAAALPRFYFPSLLSEFHCSCCFSCWSISLSSCWSLPAVGVWVPFPLGLGASFLCFVCTAEMKGSSHCLCPVVSPAFWYFTHTAVPLSLLWEHTVLPSFKERLNTSFIRVFTCWTCVALWTQVPRKAVHLPRAGARCTKGEKQGWGWLFAITEQPVSCGLCR